MPFPTSPGFRPLHIAIAISLALHGLVLFLPRHDPKRAEPSGRPPLEATLSPPLSKPAATVPPPPPAEPQPRTAPPDRKLLTVQRPRSQSRAPRWSAAEKDDMDRFLKELDRNAKARPDLAQRSLTMAREMGRHQAKQRLDEREIVEARPNAPPVDRLSLDFYLDGLVKKLNRSATFVKNDPRNRGTRTAAVLMRINPDGSLKSFKVLNAADQQEEIAFVRMVVERAVPFSAFPADLRQSAQSLGLVICVMPPSLSGGIGFARTEDGRDC
ncbi:MAG: hypothetical protein ACM3SV_01410 [Betaproteobacteria bacterium]